MMRILAVARISFLEFIRSKSLFVILFIVFCQLATLYLMAGTDAATQTRSLHSVSHLAVNIFVLLLALTLSASTLPRDMANRHLYFVFVKPLRKWEFLLGKILGCWLLIAAVVASVTLCTQLMTQTINHDEISGRVRAQSSSALMFMDMETKAEGSTLKASMPHWRQRGFQKLQAVPKEVKTLTWHLGKFKPDQDLNYLWRNNSGEVAVIKAKIDDDSNATLNLPPFKNFEGLMVATMGSRKKIPEVLGQSILKGGPSCLWQGTEIDSDFAEEGFDLIFDLRFGYPGAWYQVEVAHQDHRQTVRLNSRELHRISFPVTPHPENSIAFKLLDSSEPSLYLSPGRIWLEGRSHTVASNLWRGMGVALLHLMVVSALTLIGSLFLSQPTGMLLGFTIFLVAANATTFSEVPKTLFEDKPEHSHEHHGHDHDEHHENHDAEETFFQNVVRLSVKATLWALPDFERLNVSQYFNLGQHIPMKAFWRECLSLLGSLLLCLCFGSLVASRKEFLK